MGVWRWRSGCWGQVTAKKKKKKRIHIWTGDKVTKVNLYTTCAHSQGCCVIIYLQHSGTQHYGHLIGASVCSASKKKHTLEKWFASWLFGVWACSFFLPPTPPVLFTLSVWADSDWVSEGFHYFSFSKPRLSTSQAFQKFLMCVNERKALRLCVRPSFSPIRGPKGRPRINCRWLWKPVCLFLFCQTCPKCNNQALLVLNTFKKTGIWSVFV